MPAVKPNPPENFEPLQPGDLPTEAMSTGFAVVEYGPQPGDPSTWLSLTAVAERYKRSESTILNWAREAWFPSPLQVGGKKEWSPADLRLLDDYLLRSSRDPATPVPEYCV